MTDLAIFLGVTGILLAFVSLLIVNNQADRIRILEQRFNSHMDFHKLIQADEIAKEVKENTGQAPVIVGDKPVYNPSYGDPAVTEWLDSQFNSRKGEL